MKFILKGGDVVGIGEVCNVTRSVSIKLGGARLSRIGTLLSSSALKTIIEAWIRLHFILTNQKPTIVVLRSKIRSKKGLME